MDFAADLSRMFAFGTVTVTHGAQSTKAFKDNPDTLGSIGSFDTVSDGIRITYQTGTLNIDQDDEVVIGPTTYVVRRTYAIDDGALTVSDLKVK